MARMKQLLNEIERRSCARIVEIGTFNGRQARRMAKAAFRRSRSVTYHGFDLFELCTADSLNPASSRKTPSMSEVEAFLQDFKKEMARRPLWWRKEFAFELHRGYSSDTLASFHAAQPDFRADVILIDGGHHVDVIEQDWSYSSRMLAPGGVIFLDDYYDDPRFPGVYGANTLAARLKESGEWKVDVLPVGDAGKRGSHMRLVRVERH